jgi:hypothetical protein
MAGISIGTQLNAPAGFDNMSQGVTHYVLRNSAINGRVLLLKFEIRPAQIVKYKCGTRPDRKITPPPVPHLIALTRNRFEEGLRNGKIQRNEDQYSMPPWLLGLSDRDLSSEQQRRSSVVDHLDRINEKLKHIDYLVQDYERVLDAHNPDVLLNHHARQCVPKQNETRLRMWFYTFLIFGRNPYVLHYPVHQIGRWQRDFSSGNKRGRPSKYKGRGSGYNVTAEVQTKILKGWRRYAKLGVSLSTIYRKSITDIFGCCVRSTSVGSSNHKQFWHPSGAAFPTLRQFYYHVKKEFGHEAIRTTIYGYVRYRNKEQLTQGSFTNRTWNLMQMTERDAYVRDSISSGILNGEPMPSMHVVRSIDVASGMIIGIGFSVGGESAGAYRMALFCEAIDKVRFCSLLGYQIQQGDWPSIGASPRIVQDRGAGSTSGAFSATPEFKPVSKQSPPSHAGQSKALIETSNPKHKKNDEAPSYKKTKLNPFQVVKAEIQEVLNYNDATNVRKHVPPELAHQLPRATPLSLWNLLDGLGRNDAIMMPFDQAVRAYLTKVPAKLCGNKVSILGRDYGAKALDDAIGWRKTYGPKTLDVQVYVLDACLLKIWIDIKDKLIELDVQFAVPVANETKLMSVAECEDYFNFIQAQDTRMHEHRQAVIAEGAQKFYEAEGYKLDNVTRLPGRPNRKSSAAQQEGRALKKLFQAKVRSRA